MSVAHVMYRCADTYQHKKQEAVQVLIGNQSLTDPLVCWYADLVCLRALAQTAQALLSG
jgi:hypothetical protein